MGSGRLWDTISNATKRLGCVPSEGQPLNQGLWVSPDIREDFQIPFLDRTLSICFNVSNELGDIDANVDPDIVIQSVDKLLNYHEKSLKIRALNKHGKAS